MQVTVRTANTDIISEVTFTGSDAFRKRVVECVAIPTIIEPSAVGGATTGFAG